MIVYANWFVAFTVTGPLLIAIKSAWAVTVVIQLVVLFPGVGSLVGLPATAVLLITPVAGALTVKPRLVDEPLASVLTVQNTFVRLAFVAPPPVALINVRFAGKLSVTTTLTAVDGPLLVTAIVYVNWFVAGIVTAPVFVMARSA